MLELVRDKRAMRAASDSLASKKAALQIGMLSERKIRKLVQQLKRDAGSFSNTAAMLERQGQLAEPALLEALADPKFLGFGAATDHALDDSPAETAINLLADCGTSRSLPALRRFFHDEDLRRDALRVFATLCSADDAPELDRLLKELNEKDRSSVYSGIQNRFYKNKASDPLRSALLGVFSEYATATDGSPDFEALKSIGSIDSDVLLGLLDTEEMLFGEKFRQRKTLILLEDFHLHPSERFRERLLTDPEAQPNRDRVLCVLADPEPNKIWLDVFEHTLARMEIGDKDVSTYVMEEAVARMFRVDHWTSLFTECDPGEASPVQRDLSLLYELDRQVCNGGFLQYFFNESGPKWGATLEACDAIGLLDIRQLLEAAIRIIGLGDSDISNDSIHNRISKLTEAQESELNELDSAYYKINKYLSAKSILCILKHRAHFMNR